MGSAAERSLLAQQLVKLEGSALSGGRRRADAIREVNARIDDVNKRLGPVPSRGPAGPTSGAGPGAPELKKLTRSTVADWVMGNTSPADFERLWLLVAVLWEWAGAPDPRTPQGKGRWTATRAQWEQWWEQERGGESAPPAVPQEKSPGRLGLPIDQVDPVRHLEVHPAIEVGPRPPDANRHEQLPRYVLRAHDGRLRDEVRGAVQGTSCLVVLVGNSSTGKTRALWEAVKQLPAGWRVWRPADRTALLDGLRCQRSLARSVLWLNELQRYLLPHGQPDPDGQAAAALISLLAEPRRGPALVVGTLWHEHHTNLTRQPTEASQPDPHQQARALLSGCILTAAEDFTTHDLQAVRDLAEHDPRLAEALTNGGTRITQYLAGARELVRRYEQAPPEARAPLDAAADARRLGHSEALPEAFLRAAAVSYLNPDHWRIQTLQWRQSWFERAEAYTDQPCRGIPGPLTREVPAPGQPETGEPVYRLADYLQAHTARTRRGECPQAGFWDAATDHLQNPSDLMPLANAAKARQRLHIADRFYRTAADLGHTDALYDVALLRQEVGDRDGAERYALQAAGHGSLRAVWEVADLRETAEDWEGAERLYTRAADHGDTWALCCLARLRQKAGDIESAEHYAHQAAGRGDTRALHELVELAADLNGAERYALQAAHYGGTHVLRELARSHERSDPKTAERLYRLAADHADADALQDLARLRQEAGDHKGAELLYQQAAERGATQAMRELAWRRQRDKDPESAERLYRRAADLGDTHALAFLALRRQRAGDGDGAEQLALQAASRGDRDAVWFVVQQREIDGDPDGAERFAHQAAGNGDSTPIWYLVQRREFEGDRGGAERVYRQLAGQGDVNALLGLARLREITGDHEGAERYAHQATDRGHAEALRYLFQLRQAAGDPDGAERIAHTAADRGDSVPVLSLARLREEAGDRDGAERLYRQAADGGDAGALFALGRLREAAGDQDGADHLYCQAAAQGDSWDVHLLGLQREGKGDRDGAGRLYRRLVDQGDPWPLRCLARMQEEDGDNASAERLYRQAADHGDVPSQAVRSRWPFGLDADGRQTKRWW